MNNEKIEEYVDRIFQTLEKELSGLTDIQEFLNTCLGLQRVQTLIGDKWVTDKYILQTMAGGPNVYVDTEGKIDVWWGSFHWRYIISNKKALEKLYDIKCYLDEIAQT